MKKLLKKLNACPDAIEWVGNRTPAEAWRDCERPDWALWICERMAGQPGWPTRQMMTLAGCACAESVLHIYEAQYPGDKRPRAAIAARRAWALHPTPETLDAMNAAWF